MGEITATADAFQRDPDKVSYPEALLPEYERHARECARKVADIRRGEEKNILKQLVNVG
jgi:hypothetical protein